MTRERFIPRGPVALDPRALSIVFDVVDPPKNREVNGVAIVDVHGPLEHHESACWDSYDAIKSRVAEAAESSPRAIVLSIDSPGGLVSGCFDTAREIRALCDARGVDLYAYVDGCAASAAYALASVAKSIFVPPAGIVGSIGVIDALVDATAQDAAFGLRYTVIASGARKADGNPHVKISEEAIAAAQSRVDDLAILFFEHVKAFRPEANPLELEAALFTGRQAIDRRLADVVASFDEALSMIASGSSATETKGAAMADTNYEDAIAALRKAAEGDDTEKAANAKKMLAALDGDGEDHKEPDGDEDKGEGADSSDGDGDEDTEKKGADAKASANLASTVSALAAEVRTLKAQNERAERASLRASRPDIADEVFAALASTPLAEVKRIVNAMPKPKAPKLAAAATPAATRGDTQTSDGGPRLPPEQKRELDRRMGLLNESVGVVRAGNRLILGGFVEGGNGKVG